MLKQTNYSAQTALIPFFSIFNFCPLCCRRMVGQCAALKCQGKKLLWSKIEFELRSSGWHFDLGTCVCVCGSRCVHISLPTVYPPSSIHHGTMAYQYFTLFIVVSLSLLLLLLFRADAASCTFQFRIGAAPLLSVLRLLFIEKNSFAAFAIICVCLCSVGSGHSIRADACDFTDDPVSHSSENVRFFVVIISGIPAIFMAEHWI